MSVTVTGLGLDENPYETNFRDLLCLKIGMKLFEIFFTIPNRKLTKE
jgi:hypothetical protein